MPYRENTRGRPESPTGAMPGRGYVRPGAGVALKQQPGTSPRPKGRTSRRVNEEEWKEKPGAQEELPRERLPARLLRVWARAGRGCASGESRGEANSQMLTRSP